MKYIIIVVCILSLQAAQAQREDHTWYFSNSSKGLSFDYLTNAVSITNVHSPMIEAGSYFVACDNLSGQLLFYTDGTNVWDNNNQIMPNGSSLTNASHGMQTGLACYYPGHPNQFLLFCNTSSLPTAGSVYYSIIDMSLPGNGTLLNPRGNVVSSAKNIFLTNQSSEGMYIIKGSGNYYWLIIPKINTTNIAIYKIDATGVNLTATTNIGLNVGLAVDVRYSYVSHKIGLANMKDNGPSFTVDFNETTGALNNAYQIPGITTTSTNMCNSTDMEWSPNGQFLYITKYRDCVGSSPGKLYQYNILQPSIAPVLIAQVATSGTNASMGLKLAPNGKIYHRYISASNAYFGVINNPDLPGTACNYNLTGLNIGSNMGAMHKFPEFLVPLQCDFNAANSTTSTDFVCKPNDLTHTDIPLINIINNPCNDSITCNILHVSYGTAHIIGTDIKYVQPNYYTPTDTIILVVCNNYGICDTSETIIYLNYVGPNNPIVTFINDTLFSSASSNNQWLLNGVNILGATDSFYVPTQTGNYSVNVNDGICTSESMPYFHEYELINYNKLPNNIVNVYPNPTKDKLFIDNFNGCKLQILDVMGKEIINLNNSGCIDVSSYSSGIYFIKIIDKQSEFHSKFVIEK
ncbi:MAG: T9SS type A sorting domain-containing protein [Bacteroidia bacterium]|nr:T9SS type A sorting domain-containing protein [Bacteroidia bacterium]